MESMESSRQKQQMQSSVTTFLAFLLLLCSSSTGAAGASRVLVLMNECKYKLWPATLGNAGAGAVGAGGWELAPGETTSVEAPGDWSGRLWARTGCDLGSGAACLTGDCGGSGVACAGGAGPTLPVTLVEFTLSTNIDYYDVSLVDGFNVPVSVAAATASVGCGVASCAADVNSICPAELRVYSNDSSAEVVGCRSACEAFGSPQYCCSGAFSNPSTCSPSNYSQIFKSACPTAYSYAFDDATSTFTCSASPPPSYLITFCPAATADAAGANSTQRTSTSYGTPPSTSSSSSILDWTPNSSSHHKLCGNHLCTCILTIFSHLLLHQFLRHSL